MITTVTLNPAIDKTITLDKLEYGSVNRVQKGIIDTGGKGLNVSKVLGKLGNRTTAIGFLGEKNKALVMTLLEKELIETEYISIEDETRTNTILVDMERGITTNLNEEGFFVDEAHYVALKALVAQYAVHSDYMVFSGSAPKGISDTVYGELIGIANKDCLTVLDADDELLIEGLKASPYLIKPNIHELENAFNVEIHTDEEVVAVSRKIIKDFQVKLVLISMGGEGSLLVTEQEVYKALPIQVEVRSTVGAGDSLVAGFIHGLAHSMPLKDCLAYGTVCGTLAVTREGVGNFTKDEMVTFLERAVVEKLDM